MTRGEIYRTAERSPERGDKPSACVVVVAPFHRGERRRDHRDLRAGYSRILGISTEVVLGPAEGLPRTSAARCDFLALLFKRRLTTLVGRLSGRRVAELDAALAVALDLPPPGA